VQYVVDCNLAGREPQAKIVKQGETPA